MHPSSLVLDALLNFHCKYVFIQNLFHIEVELRLYKGAFFLNFVINRRGSQFIDYTDGNNIC